MKKKIVISFVYVHMTITLVYGILFWCILFIRFSLRHPVFRLIFKKTPCCLRIFSLWLLTHLSKKIHFIRLSIVSFEFWNLSCFHCWIFHKLCCRIKQDEVRFSLGILKACIYSIAIQKVRAGPWQLAQVAIHCCLRYFSLSF